MLGENTDQVESLESILRTGALCTAKLDETKQCTVCVRALHRVPYNFSEEYGRFWDAADGRVSRPSDEPSPSSEDRIKC